MGVEINVIGLDKKVRKKVYMGGYARIMRVAGVWEKARSAGLCCG